MMTSESYSIIQWKCPKCKRQARVRDDYQVSCPCGTITTAQGELKSYQPTWVTWCKNNKFLTIPAHILERGKNYIQAWKKWVMAGRPKRTLAEVEILLRICQECDNYDSDKHTCTHNLCGCSIGKDNWWGSKLRWATEHCPINKW